MTFFGIKSVDQLQNFLSVNLPSLVFAFTVTVGGMIVGIDRVSTRLSAQESTTAEYFAKIDRYIDLHDREHLEEKRERDRANENITLLVEEYQDTVRREMKIGFLESEIVRIAGDIGNFEFIAETSQSTEARQIARDRLAAAEARMSAKVRELNRLMQPGL